MKLVTTKIEGCASCPDCVYNYATGGYECARSNNRKVEIGCKIPDWCTRPDAPNEKVEKEVPTL